MVGSSNQIKLPPSIFQVRLMNFHSFKSADKIFTIIRTRGFYSGSGKSPESS